IIKFSHKYHQEEVGTACVDCHTRAAESTSAGDNLLVTKEECAVCHDVETEENCTLCHYEDEDTWQLFANPPRDIMFNHKFHVEEADMECETCHPNLNDVDYANAESMPTMQDCASCHDNQQASLECGSCHTSTLNLRPVDHTPDFLVTHKNITRLDSEECGICHTENDCAECHEGASLVRSSSDVFTPFFPSTGGGTKGLLISRVHDLNYRFTHPLEAEGRSQECATCHETRSFCQDCHEAEGVDVAQKPLWHGGPNWGALAGVVGTGGGRHAELAKRDIENCAGCHSTEGDDPTCLLCHTDFDGIRGTNPKTHETGFANRFSEDSDFHNDDAAICYSCHTNTQQFGLGFCGYCHN
ncbi:cytochrome c3 family protein, partial [candidate division KSB1 bacterium]|nr:cytochrome c3 family protein [candidate division KSB1 bacterium]NIR72082.1 cytochrome c3 family protein [candidate division KSB1 bacterium]NIS25022.1 cytochrome c3 family protein [candidate division KSB1 bacterium]NIT71932.1 cytochrome c3 family protein [candidate division KSB1 bacterium]NIU25675.1 cytochrome c3 family protein [candidate division KSB1 bacterium]